jgi:hypothetical protein
MADPTTGVLSFTSAEQVLPKNAVVRAYTVIVTAAPAGQARLGDVAVVRVDVANETAVLDFGVLRTVRGLSVAGLSGAKISSIAAWTGVAYGPTLALVGAASAVVSFAETRTERLQVVLTGLAGTQQAQEKALADKALLALADAPADLELRLAGGPVLWSHPGPVRAGSPFSVDLTAAVAPLAGDPTGRSNVSFQLVLSSRAPGVLKVAPDVRDYSRITRLALEADELTFATEGLQTVELDLPGAKSIEEVGFTAVGTFAPERVLAPVGPPASAAAELAVDADHAFCVRLAAVADPAGDLAGVRLPLVAAPGGAEARVVLWSGADGEPAAPLDGGGSEPVALAPPAVPDGDVWTTFPFRRPVPLAAGRDLWAALLVSRGAVTWGLLEAAAGSPLLVHELRRGGPAGPWRLLPSLFRAGDLANLRGRVRVVVLPAKTAPLSPLLVRIGGGAAQEVTPATRGVPVDLRFQTALAITGQSARLEVTSRAAGTVSLREVDVVWNTTVPLQFGDLQAADLVPFAAGALFSQ